MIAFMPHVAVVTISDRSAAGVRTDRSGPLAQKLLSEYAQVSGVVIVPDDADAITAAICRRSQRRVHHGRHRLFHA